MAMVDIGGGSLSMNLRVMPLNSLLVVPLRQSQKGREIVTV